MPLQFAVHPWFVVERNGVETRWEVLHVKNKSKESWGYLHKNVLPPRSGMKIFPFLEVRWPAQLVGEVSGAVAQEIAHILESSPQTYPYTEHYSLFGPNSNSFASWVLQRAPSWKVRLPRNAFGKNFQFPL